MARLAPQPGRPGPAPVLRRAAAMARLTLAGLTAAAAVLAVAAYLQLSQAQERRPWSAGVTTGIAIDNGVLHR